MSGFFKRKFSLSKQNDPNFHTLSFQDLETQLSTSLTYGLTTQIAQQRFRETHPNLISPPNHNRFFQVLGYFFTGFCGILWIAALVCILAWKPIGSPPDPTNLGLGILLIVVILLQASFSAFQDWTSSKVMSSIKKMMPQKANVFRDGTDRIVFSEEIVVGDVVNLTYGKKVPADIRIIESHDLKFDKSMLTGESDAIDGTVYCTELQYNEAKNIAFMTSLITNGSGKGVVIKTGDDTMIGNITKMTTKTKNEQTSLQKDITRFVILIAILAGVTSSLIAIVWGTYLNPYFPGFLDVSGMLVNLISVAVAFVPEGLPVSVTLVLLIMAKRMAKNNILVKNLTTLETLSAVNVICSDKTGTLTKNIMHVNSVLIGEEKIYAEPHNDLNATEEAEQSNLMGSINDKKKGNEIYLRKDQKTSTAEQLICLALLCNNAKFDANTGKIEADATDKAIMEFALNHTSYQVKDSYKTISEIPFNSRNKWMMKLVQPILPSPHFSIFEEVDYPNPHMILMKGAPEILLSKCKFFLSKNGDIQPLTQNHKQFIYDTQSEWSTSGQRVLVLIRKMISEHDTLELCLLNKIDLDKKIHEQNDFIFVGMVGIIDPPRDGIQEVMQKCKLAGIRIFMVTGDHALTAAAIARQVGIFSSLKPDLLDDVRKMEEIVPANIKRSVDIDSIKGSLLGNEGTNFVFGNHNNSKLEANSSINPIPNRKRMAHTLRSGGELNSLLLNGTDLDYLSPDDWLFVTKYDEIVFARTSPEQKLKVVTEFQKYGNIVGVTGDGVNDAPSLKKANIGIAMGSGSDVAMEAAELVLLDSNFSSILVALENGRLIFQNLRKVIIYLLPAGSFAEIVPVLVNTFLGVPQTLSSFLMIVICILTDVFPSLAMMMEKAEKDLLKSAPRSPSEHIVNYKLMLHSYAFIGILETFFSHVMFFVYMEYYAGIPPSALLLCFNNWQDKYLGKSIDELNEALYTAQCIYFVTLVFMQLFGNSLATRTNRLSLFSVLPWKPESKNYYIFLAWGASLTCMFFILALPACQDIFNTRMPPVEFYFVGIGFGMVILVLDEARKYMVRKKVGFFKKVAW